MRRRWIVVAAVVACAALAGQTGTASAQDGSRHAAASCASLVKGYQKVSSSTSNTDITKPASVSKAFKDAQKVVNKLAGSAPSEIKAALKHLGQVYGQLAKLDFSKSASFSQVGTAFQGLVSDLQKIASYFAGKCHYTIPTGGTAQPTS
jgi:type VI protein secretion system component VasK